MIHVNLLTEIHKKVRLANCRPAVRVIQEPHGSIADPSFYKLMVLVHILESKGGSLRFEKVVLVGKDEPLVVSYTQSEGDPRIQRYRLCPARYRRLGDPWGG
jgi:hypothetical protein